MSAVPVPDDLASRLTERARRDGVSEEKLVERALRGFLDQDPYEFFEVGASDQLRGDRVDERLRETGFGRPRS
jgi:hypothetical protein